MVLTTQAHVGGVAGHVIPPFYSDFLRDNLYPNLYLRQFGTKVTIPRGFGDKVKIPRWSTPVKSPGGVAGLCGVITAICAGPAEGGPSSLFGLSAQDITGDVRQFVGARGYTDKLIIVTKANFLEGALESLARELAFKFDLQTRGDVSANSTLDYIDLAPTAAGKVASTGTVIGKNVANIRPKLDSYNVPPWDDEQFVAVGHPVIQRDLFTDISSTGFVSVARYNDAQRIYRGEIGNMYGIRFVLSNAMPLYGGPGGVFSSVLATSGTTGSFGISGGATGGNLWVIAPDAYYSLELEDGGVEVIHHPPGSAGTADAGNQQGSIAVKAFYGACPAPAADKRLWRFAHGVSLTP
jgi:N4-gp56 family major capsid protein